MPTSCRSVTFLQKRGAAPPLPRCFNAHRISCRRNALDHRRRGPLCAMQRASLLPEDGRFTKKTVPIRCWVFEESLHFGRSFIFNTFATERTTLQPLHQFKAAAKIDLVWVELGWKGRFRATSMDASPIDFSREGSRPSDKFQPQSWQVLEDVFAE